MPPTITSIPSGEIGILTPLQFDYDAAVSAVDAGELYVAPASDSGGGAVIQFPGSRTGNDGGDDTPGLAVKVSTYAYDGRGDVVLDTAVSRLGLNISDAVITVGDLAVLSRRLSVVYSRIGGLDAAGRKQRLIDLADHVYISNDPVAESEVGLDFQVVTVASRLADIYSAPALHHLRQYRIFERDNTQSVIAYTHYPDDANRQLRKDFLESDRGAIACLLDGIREYINRADLSGLQALCSAKALAIQYESLARTLDSGALRRNEPALISSEGEEMLEALWKHFKLAHRAFVNGGGIPDGFDAANESLMLFLGRRGVYGLHAEVNKEER